MAEVGLLWGTAEEQGEGGVDARFTALAEHEERRRICLEGLNFRSRIVSRRARSKWPEGPCWLSDENCDSTS